MLYECSINRVCASLHVNVRIAQMFAVAIDQRLLRPNIISWNCRGLQKLKKLKQVMNKIKDIDSKTVFLRETHLLEEDNKKKIRRRWQRTHIIIFIPRKRCSDSYT